MAKMSKREMNYRIDFTKMTLTMTAEFADNAYNPTTEEYAILTRLQKDFPQLRVVRKTHRSPKTANPAKGLTFDRMEKYILLHENADELIDLQDGEQDPEKNSAIAVYLFDITELSGLVAERDICFIFSTSSGVFSISATVAVFIFPYFTTYRFTGKLK